MYESNLAENAYSNSSLQIGTPRGVEYRLFARVTRQLSVKFDEIAPDRFARRAKAIYDNEQLWAALACDVAGESNGLPAELRSKIFYLYEFTRIHGRKVLQGAATPDVLVEINTAVMRGLQGVAEEEEAA